MTSKTIHRTTQSVGLSDDGLRLVAELNEPRFGQLRDIFSACDDQAAAGTPLSRRPQAGGLFRQQLVPAIAPFVSASWLHLQLGADRSPTLASEGFDLAIRHCRRGALPDTTSRPLCHTATPPSRPQTIIPPPWPRPGDPEICRGA